MFFVCKPFPRKDMITLKRTAWSFSDLKPFEWWLWGVSTLVVALSFLLFPGKDWLSLTASLIGVTALIFVAKGRVIGQLLTVVFAVFYGIISFYFKYYGEMLTYLCMTSPMAVLAALEWWRKPYKGTKEVEVGRLSSKSVAIMLALTVEVTVIFYFVLKALGNANLWVSTLSVTTSFLASSLTFLRSPYYALAYAANDLVLISLWVMATFKDISYLPMIFCFIMFFINDLYGFYNWRKMEKRQSE